MKDLFGTTVMRGKVVSVDDEGKCVVLGIDQPGITTMPLPVMAGQKIEKGSTVIYCEFANGQGAVFMPI